MPYWIGLVALGAGLGACIGLLAEEIGVWIAIGATFGLACGAALRAEGNRRD